MAPAQDGLVEYKPGEPFPGTVGRTIETSTPAWKALPRPPQGAPNVVVIVLDDVGFGQLSAYGGLCETPNIDRLASRGIRLSNFHTTALCSPTRACLLTGRNHHTLGMSAVTELSFGYPGHDATPGPEHGFLPEILRSQGYNTFAVGKWHLTSPDQMTPAGPFDHWPLGRGFERYYGFLGGDTDQYNPDLVEDNHWVSAPATPEEGYHLNADIADKAISFIRDVQVAAPNKPFFLYYATGAGHAPHQVEPEWVEPFKGRFDMGWDRYREEVFARQMELGLLPQGTELSTRDPDVPAWDSLGDQEKHTYARQMEVYAGFIQQTDHHIGRVIDFIERIGRLDNTVVVLLSDNGASAEGGTHGTPNETMFFNMVPESLESSLDKLDRWGSEDTFCHYSWGWAWAGDTPFRRWKRETYRGGITDPCIISWPEQLPPGEVRAQYAHAIDIAPTLLELLGISPPEVIKGVEQSPMQGVSLVTALRDATTPSEHVTQYFEMMGHRSIYHQGWKAVCPYPAASMSEAPGGAGSLASFFSEAVLDNLDANAWELYHLDADPAECHDLAAAEPERLGHMRDLWWEEARKYGALPLAAVDATRVLSPRPRIDGNRSAFIMYPDAAPLPFMAAPRVNNLSHRVLVHATIPEGGADGVLLSHGNRHGGFCLYVKDSVLVYTYNYLGLERVTIRASDELPAGEVHLSLEVTIDGFPDLLNGKGSPQSVELRYGPRVVGEGRVDTTVPFIFAMAGMSCGFAAVDSVDPATYAKPFRFTGDLHELVLEIGGTPVIDPEAEFARYMAQQ